MIPENTPPAPGRDDEADAEFFVSGAITNHLAAFNEILSTESQNRMRIGFLAGRKGFVPASEVERLKRWLSDTVEENEKLIDSRKSVAEAREAARKEERERCAKICESKCCSQELALKILNPAPSETEGGEK